ncbi:MAG: phosphoribosyltransferase [Planctomycetes bacterium]|nr:phosphoribosyltransferase [Planctomycetota bacterium]
MVPNALWPANALCRAIVEIGLARETMPLLSRTKPVKKSATAERGHRPRPDEHYETLRATASLNPVRRAVLVDDVVTKGSTLVAAASRLREVLPNSEIVGFSAVRTMGLIPEVDRIIQPVRSTITFNGFDAARHD